MNYRDRISLLYREKGKYIAILNENYRLDGSMIVEGDSMDSVVADIMRADDRWVTINGSHVLIGYNGRIKYGAGGIFNGKKFGTRFNGKGPIKKPKIWGNGRRLKDIQAEKRAEIMPTKVQLNKLKSIARKTKNLKNEQLRIVDREGNVVLEKKGDKISVTCTVGEMRAVAWGNISIHNHPAGGTFSPADLRQFGYGVTEIRAACPEGTYILRNLNYGRNSKKSWYDLQQAYMLFEEKKVLKSSNHPERYKQKYAKYSNEYKSIFDEFQKRKAEGASSEELKALIDKHNKLRVEVQKKVDAEIRAEDVLPHHKWFVKNAAKYGFEYVLEK